MSTPVAVTFPDFAVACGEEASDPLVPYQGAIVRVDELAASGHLARQDADLADVAGLGVRWWRYGMPWRHTEPAPGEYDWTLWDQALAACDRHGLTPVVDLCHFGLPDHLGGFCDPAWVDSFCRYVDAFLTRYREPMFFTPVNEPMITAMASALYGIWNDQRASRADFFRALANTTLANLEAIARIDADRGGWWIGAEGFGRHLAADADHEAEAIAANELERLVWDLHFGTEPAPSAHDVYEAVDPVLLDRIATRRVVTERVVVGHDFYPVSAHLHGRRDEPLSIEERIAAYDLAAREWHARYQRPFWVAETSNLGLDVADGSRWLTELVACLDRLRA
ncbi:MAG TPA: family 1 glycosylhydrolase, partial [Ilumatobacteraceae bacterium]|nr:family 1 glycosylhydrolase [Ilumatobacteraceae bacterium]